MWSQWLNRKELPGTFLALTVFCTMVHALLCAGAQALESFRINTSNSTVLWCCRPNSNVQSSVVNAFIYQVAGKLQHFLWTFDGHWTSLVLRHEGVSYNNSRHIKMQQHIVSSSLYLRLYWATKTKTGHLIRLELSAVQKTRRKVKAYPSFPTTVKSSPWIVSD